MPPSKQAKKSSSTHAHSSAASEDHADTFHRRRSQRLASKPGSTSRSPSPAEVAPKEAKKKKNNEAANQNQPSTSTVFSPRRTRSKGPRVEPAQPVKKLVLPSKRSKEDTDSSSEASEDIPVVKSKKLTRSTVATKNQPSTSNQASKAKVDSRKSRMGQNLAKTSKIAVEDSQEDDDTHSVEFPLPSTSGPVTRRQAKATTTKSKDSPEVEKAKANPPSKSSKEKEEKKERPKQYAVRSGGPPGGHKNVARKSTSSRPATEAATTATTTTAAGSLAAMAQNGGTGGRTGMSTDPAGLATNIFTALGDIEALSAAGEDFDINRLQSLLEQRGISSSLFSSLGPRFQAMLGRIGSQGGGSTQCYNKSNQLIASLKNPDNSVQLAAAAEICQMLVMGNEDTLHGFPMKQAVTALTAVISGESNYELVTQCIRALSSMMDSLPRSSAVVTTAIPDLLLKLQSIEYIDVLEQTLVALEMLSRRHAKQILRANGVQSVLNYIEFFTDPAVQRNALQITASCCSNLSVEEFEFVQPVLPLLSQRITLGTDKKCVEYTCVAFSRIAECFHNDADKLREVASHGLLPNIQQLLMGYPAAISSQTFIMVLQMLTHICVSCPDLAAHLLDSNITDTLFYLLTGSSSRSVRVELSKSAKSPQEGYELIRLVGALMPGLPTDGIFAVDDLLKKVGGAGELTAKWFWKDDSNNWVAYTNAEAGIIENAFRTGQEDVMIDTPQAQYSIEFSGMHQINEDTGTSREVKREDIKPSQRTSRSSDVVLQSKDPNVATFISSIFSVLYEVYCTSAGTAIRHKCSEALLKMVYHSSPELLYSVMVNLPISSNIASNLATSDVKSVIYAVQLSDTLMQKLPKIFSDHFRREGVVFQMNLCAKGDSVLFKHQTEPSIVPPSSDPVAPLALDSSSVNSAPSSSSNVEPTASSNESSQSRKAAATTRRQSHRRQQLSQPPPATTRRRHNAGTGSSSNPTSSSNNEGATGDGTSGESSSTGATSTLNKMASRIAVEGRAMLDRLSSLAGNGQAGSSGTPVTPQSAAAGQAAYRQQATEWIKTQAAKFLDEHFSAFNSSQSGSSAQLMAAVDKLKSEKEVSALKEIREVILEGHVSPFEVVHSNLIGTLLRYLTENEWLGDGETPSAGTVVVKRAKRKARCEPKGSSRHLRLLRFMHIFFHCPAEHEVLNNFIDVFDVSNSIDSVPAFKALVAKLNACVNQLEQFPVRLTDLTTSGLGGTGTSGGRHPIMRVFSQSQLKCQLSRHPDCPNIRLWRGGMVRVEPLAPVYTIERYLVARGCARPATAEENALDTDEVSDEDELDAMSMAAEAGRVNGRYRLELLYNNNVLPYNWSLYQCIRHFSRGAEEAEGDSDYHTGQLALFTNTHTIHYRLNGEENAGHGPTEDNPQGVKSSAKTEKEEKPRSAYDTGVIPSVESTLDLHLTSAIPEYVTVRDPSLEALTLLRVLHGLNLHWAELYQPQAKVMPRLTDLDFHNSKLVTKMNRQLQDPMMILTGQIPFWLQQVPVYSPFLFPFEPRLQLFFVTAFDRDRAMQRLLDTNPELAANRTANQASQSSSHIDHMTPRIERKKETVTRKNLLVQTQSIMDVHAQSRKSLEIQYHEEVGTGLGPTLEFYSMVSKEFQKTELGLWHSASAHKTTGLYVYAPCGLFPKPIASHTSKARVAEVEGKFRLLGKFMAKALMDFRMIDISCSPVFYKWLLGQESHLGLADLAHIDPEIYKQVEKLYRISRRKKWLDANSEVGDTKLECDDDEVLYDGATVEDLCLMHVLPGYEDIELCRGGRDKLVTLDNLESYINMVVYFYLRDGVHRQMEAFRDAFGSVIQVKHLQLFRAEELDAVFCGHGDHLTEGWDIQTLKDTCHPDHGFNVESRAIQWLFNILSKYNAEERRNFVQFVTGSPKLPVGGFKALNPPFTVVKKIVGESQKPDQFLPSVMTCVNYLKLPDYTSMDIMKKQIQMACKEGQHSFHLS